MAFVRLDSSSPTQNSNWNARSDSDEQTLLPSSDVLGKLHVLEETVRCSEGRWIGFLSYDLGDHMRDGCEDYRACETPLFAFSFDSKDVAFEAPEPPALKHAASPPQVLQSDFTRDQYLQAVSRCKEYIAAGDIYQVNLSQRFTLEL